MGGHISSVTIHSHAGQWVASINVKVTEKLYELFILGRHYGKRGSNGRLVGIDVGLEKLATLSDGSWVANPRFYRKELERFKKAQRRLSRKEGRGKGKRKTPSNGYKRELLELQRAHKRVTDQRENLLHQLSRWVVDSFEVVCIEDLNIKGMLKNRRLSKSISDASWGVLFSFLGYKLERAGGVLVRVDQFFPSSKLFSGCAQVRAKLELSERVFECDCGRVLDRDLNAALNLLGVLYAEGYSVGVGEDSSSLRDLIPTLFELHFGGEARSVVPNDSVIIESNASQ